MRKRCFVVITFRLPISKKTAILGFGVNMSTAGKPWTMSTAHRLCRRRWIALTAITAAMLVAGDGSDRAAAKGAQATVRGITSGSQGASQVPPAALQIASAPCSVACVHPSQAQADQPAIKPPHLHRGRRALLWGGRPPARLMPVRADDPNDDGASDDPNDDDDAWDDLSAYQDTGVPIIVWLQTESLLHLVTPEHAPAISTPSLPSPFRTLQRLRC